MVGRNLSFVDLPRDVRLQCVRCGLLIREGGGEPRYIYCPGNPDRIEGEFTTEQQAPARIGRYTPLRLLGRGGAGVVYQAWDNELQRTVALKLLLLGAWASREEQARFRKEATTAAALNLPGIVRVLDTGRTPEGVPWIAMELVEGPSLARVIEDRGALPLIEAVRVTQVVAATLHALHQAGFAHRDLKPSNLLLTPLGQPLLSDFGLIVDLDSLTRFTASGNMVGTPAYMAPELLRAPNGLIDWVRADVYGLGSILFESLTGKPPPFDAAERYALLTQAKLPEDIIAACEAALVVDPAQRLPSAQALSERLQQARLEERSPRLLPRLRRYMVAHQRQLSIGVALVLSAAVLLGAGATWNDWRQQREQEEWTATVEGRLEQALAQIDTALANDNLSEAEKIFRNFVELPEHTRSPVLSRAWLQYGDRMLDHNETEAAINAFGSAYIRSAETENQALLGLIRALRHGRRWDALGRALELAARDHPRLAVPGQPRMAWEIAAARGDITTAVAALGAEGARLKPFINAMRLPEGGAVRLVRDIDGDGIDELLMQKPDGSLLLAQGPNQSKLLTMSNHPAEGAVPALDYDGEFIRLLRLNTTSAAVVARWPAQTHAVQWATVHGASGEAIFATTGGYDRRFLRIDPTHGTIQPAHVPTGALHSYMEALTLIDLDGDRTRELVVGTGPPDGYDLRVFDVQAALQLRTRRPFGFISGMVPLTRADGAQILATGVSHERPSRYVFPEGDHQGVALGVHLLSGMSLEPGPLLPTPLLSNGLVSVPIGATDIDQDGREDLVVSHQGRNMGTAVLGLYYQQSDGSFAEIFIEGWNPIALLQWDDDPAPEILIEGVSGAEDDHLWVLGVGDNTLPTSPIPTLDAPMTELSGDWVRVARLEQVGLVEVAAREFAILARLETDPARRLDGWRRAAALHDALGQKDEAAVAWEQASVQQKSTPYDLQSAMNAWIESAHHTEALAAARRLAALADLPTPVLAAAQDAEKWLSDLLEPPEKLVYTFEIPLSDDVQLLTPELVHRNPRTATLEIDAIRGAGPLVRIPLRRVSDTFSLSLSLTIERQEWGSALHVLLRPRGGHSVDLELGGYGGGGFLERQIFLGDRLMQEPMDGPTAPTRLEIQILRTPARPGGIVIIQQDGQDVVRTAVPRLDVPDGEEWELVLSSPAEGLSGQWAKFSIHNLYISGFVTTPNAPMEPAPDSLLRTAALLRQNPGRADLWRQLGPRVFFATLQEALVSAARMHPNDPELLNLLTRQIPDPTPHIRNNEAAQELLALRGRAFWQQGDEASARRDLEAVLSVAARTPGARSCFEGAATLAEIELTSANEARAIAWARVALQCAPDPDIGREQLRRIPSLAKALHQPGWTEIWP